MKPTLALLMIFLFPFLTYADTTAASSLARRAYCIATVGEFEPVVFDGIAPDQAQYGVITGDGVSVNYQFVYFLDDNGKPGLYLVFSVTKGDKVIMVSTDTFNEDNETSVTAEAAHIEIQHALATNPNYESIADVYKAKGIPEDEPFWIHMTCSLLENNKN